MITTLSILKLKPEQAIEQQFYDEIADVEPEKIIEFIESLSPESLEEPGNFLGFIYRKSIAQLN